MNLRRAIPEIILFAWAAVMLCAAGSAQSAEREIAKPQPKVIQLDTAGKREQQLLSGPPETVTMRSGHILLQPGQSVGKHSTGHNEEMLVVLEGQGRMVFDDGSHLDLSANHVLYCPPATAHDVLNTGTGVLRYIYIVAHAE